MQTDRPRPAAAPPAPPPRALRAWLPALAAVLLFLPPRPAAAHSFSADDVQHLWTVTVKEGVIELELDCLFQGDPAAALRTAIDTDGDANGRLSAAEARQYALARHDEWTSAVALHQETRPLKLTPLYPPRVELLDADHTGPAPLRLRLAWFTRHDEPALYYLDDLLWLDRPAMLSLATAGDPPPRIVQPAGAHQHARPTEPRYLAFQIEPPPWDPDARQSRFDALGAAELIGRLVSDQAYHLLAPGHQAELEELNRELHESMELRTLYHVNRGTSTFPPAARELWDKVLRLIEQSGRLIEAPLEPGHPALPLAGPFELPGDVGALVIRARADGLDETRFQIHDFSFSAYDIMEHAKIDLPATGTTYILLNLRDVPAGGVRTVFELYTSRRAMPWSLPIEVVPPAPARLALRVDDDRDQPGPFMVRLNWLLDGSDRKPPNVVELADQFEGQGYATSLRTSHMPGVMNKSYWCVPGPFEMPIPPGRYGLSVRRGIEYVPVTRIFSAASGERLELTVNLRRWTDMPARGWWSGDDHAHLRIQTDEDAARALRWAEAEDVHVVNVLEMSSIARRHFVQRGFGPSFRARTGDYALVPGQETPRTHNELGHVLALNILDLIHFADRYFLYDLVFDEAHRQGGLTGYAHVVNLPRFEVDRDMSLNIPKGKVDFLEVLQRGELGTTVSYDFLNLGFKLVFAAGSDVPYGGSLGEVRTYVHTGNRKTLDVDAWFDAFRQGRTFVTNGPMLELEVEGAGPGEELRIEAPRPLSVKARAWGHAGYTVPARLEIVRLGEVAADIRSDDDQREELTLRARVDSGDGCWIAARVTGHDGTVAHTTPVWVVRPPLRFWKYEAAPGLIAQRRARLDEIEQLVHHARRLEAAGALQGWTARGFPWLIEEDIQRELARQGDDLLERVAAARAIYDELLRVHAREAPLRAGSSAR